MRYARCFLGSQYCTDAVHIHDVNLPNFCRMQQMQSTEVQSQRVGIIGTIKLAERLAQPLPISSSQPGPHGGVPSLNNFDRCYCLHIAFCYVAEASCSPEASVPSQTLSLKSC